MAGLRLSLDWNAWSRWDYDFDVRVFNPLVASNRNTPLSSVFWRREQEKCREYDQRIRKIEHDSFAPLVFAAYGGMGPCTKIAYNRHASLLASRRGHMYSTTTQWLCCRLSFSLQYKISHHSHQRNKSVCPHPNPVNLPGLAEGRIRYINKFKTLFCFFIISAWLGSVMVDYSCNHTSRQSNGPMSGVKNSDVSAQSRRLGISGRNHTKWTGMEGHYHWSTIH